MGTCATCQYWQQVRSWWQGEEFLLGTHDRRPCTHPLLNITLYSCPADADPAAAIMVNGEAAGMLYTGPAFGCVHWQAREEGGV